jgi:poly(3-hydroxybutyrate) depolymerase
VQNKLGSTKTPGNGEAFGVLRLDAAAIASVFDDAWERNSHGKAVSGHRTLEASPIPEFARSSNKHDRGDNNMQKWLAAILAICSLMATPVSGLVQQNCPPNSLGPGDYTFTLQSGGLTRSYDLHVPNGVSSATPASLIVDIHGFTQTKEDQARRSDFKSLSNANGFLVAYPQGINNQWNAGDAIFLGDPNINDVAFIRALVADVARRVRIDHSRVYATGHSNGSMLTHRIACEAADLFAGIAGMSGGLQFSNFNDCRPSRPISVKMYHGLNDNIVPYNGGGIGFRPIRDTFDFWARTNQCSGTPQIFTNGRNKCETYTNCANGTQVSLCSLVALHNNIYDLRVLNVSSDALSFFRQFRLPLPDADRDGIPDLDECR